MKKIITGLLICIVSFQFCTTSKKVAETKEPPPPITYLSNIQPMISANCSPCHIPPKGFQKALDNYITAKDKIDDILRRVNLNPGERDFMPFKHPKMSDSAINVFVQWKNNGLLEK